MEGMDRLAAFGRCAMKPSSVGRCACGARWHQVASRTCATCHLTFSSEFAWELHKTGPHPRSCVDPSSLYTKAGERALRIKLDREGHAVWTPPPTDYFPVGGAR